MKHARGTLVAAGIVVIVGVLVVAAMLVRDGDGSGSENGSTAAGGADAQETETGDDAGTGDQPATDSGDGAGTADAPATGTGDDAGDSGDPGAASAVRVEFERGVIDPEPPTGDGCCLDVLVDGDVDGDGLVDLVIGTEGADGVSWYRNPGDATEGWERFPIGTGDFTTDAEVADLDGDGDLDVVASSIDRNVVEWWAQVGDPTTESGWQRHEIGADWAHDLVVADLDGDGDDDVAAYHVEVGRIDWYERPDDPTTEWAAHVVDERPGEGLAAADLDGDGSIDLVAGPAVYRNTDGTGQAWERTALSETWEPRARAAVGDIDGDGVLDIALASPETDGPLAWFQGPDWTEMQIEDDAGFAHSLELGDVDQDGDLDLMVGVMHWAGTRKVRVLLGDGGSTWTEVELADTGTHNARLVDLDGDGLLDVVGKNFEGPKQVEVWWNRSTGAAGNSERPVAQGGASTPLDGFSYVEVDNSRERFNDSTAFFGLAFGDLDGDGDDDIASGAYVYLNPGGDMAGTWERVDLEPQLGTKVDAMLVTDVDGDDAADVIATALPDVWWLESTDGVSWTGQVVASVPATPRPNGQGYRLGDLTGDGRTEIVLSGGNGESDVWYLTVPNDPSVTPWEATRITETATDEQIGIGDIDGDGDNDIAAGDMQDGGEYIAWFENPGDGSSDWMRHRLGGFPGIYPDRLDVVDLDGDGLLDVVVSEENGGETDDAEVMWYRNPGDPTSEDWPRTVVVTQYTTNGMDVADLDADGDVDLVTGEHRGPKRVSVWENAGSDDGGVTWIEHPVDDGKESHLGARVWDLDDDGDLEIVSIAWDDPQYLHLWVND